MPDTLGPPIREVDPSTIDIKQTDTCVLYNVMVQLRSLPTSEVFQYIPVLNKIRSELDRRFQGQTETAESFCRNSGKIILDMNNEEVITDTKPADYSMNIQTDTQAIQTTIAKTDLTSVNWWKWGCIALVGYIFLKKI